MLVPHFLSFTLHAPCVMPISRGHLSWTQPNKAVRGWSSVALKMHAVGSWRVKSPLWVCSCGSRFPRRVFCNSLSCTRLFPYTPFQTRESMRISSLTSTVSSFQCFTRRSSILYTGVDSWLPGNDNDYGSAKCSQKTHLKAEMMRNFDVLTSHFSKYRSEFHSTMPRNIMKVLAILRLWW